MTHLIRPRNCTANSVDITPASAHWRFLSFKLLELQRGWTRTHHTQETEVALLPLSGKATVEVAGVQYSLSRHDVFAEMSDLLYVPPAQDIHIFADTDCEMAVGGAPAEGRYPVRLIRRDEIRAEVRGGGTATRQVHHLLAYPLPAERLIVYEVFVPGGHWAGWPPHCHDGFGASPYLEETYYFRMDPRHGFGMHRNWRTDADFDETFAARHGDVVLVTQGFHSTTAAPNCRMYFLNYLAGDLQDDARGTPPFDEPQFARIKQDWNTNAMQLPLFQPQVEHK
jgi:5-deoxy-glucuronate isomerase